MDISVASYAFHGLLKRGQIDLFGYLESCRYRYHLDSADIWNGFLPSIDEAYLALAKDALAERDLVLANLCVDGPHIWEDDPALRESHYRDALTYLHVAEVLGARTIRIDAGVRAADFTEEQFDHIVARYREYAQRAHDNGYRVGPENHWGAEAVPENMVRICQAVNHPGFGMLLHFRGTPADASMAPWAMHTHISWEVALNRLAESMNMLRAAGYRGFWGVEHHTGVNEYAEVAAQVAHVAAVLETWRAAAI